MDKKEIKAEIRRLKKIKLSCRPGTTERLDLEHKIKELKGQIAKAEVVEPGKVELIAEITRLDDWITKLSIDLNKFSIADLEKHLLKLKGRGKNVKAI